MNIIDSHIHICRCINGFGNSGEMQAIGGGYASYADGTIFQMIPECLGEYDVTPEAVLKIMDEAGVSKAVMLQGNFLGPQNLYTYEAAKKYPDRLAAAATYDPFCRNVDSIRKHLFEDLGIKIVKFEVSTGSGLMSYHPTIPLDGDGKLIVVEEYVQGRSLKQVLDEQGLLNEEQAYEIAVQLVDILVRLHQLEPAIVHRDIKPSNIIIEKNGHVNLIDFNAARHVNADKNEDTRMLGTVYFAAPEQFGFGQSDERTDIYGLGATINYIMTGDKPGQSNCTLHRMPYEPY
jgi:serine/threonine protein kinase